jgi:hypothetical protein
VVSLILGAALSSSCGKAVRGGIKIDTAGHSRLLYRASGPKRSGKREGNVMRHLKPVTKAELSWFDENPLDIILGILQAIASIMPIIQSYLDAKQPQTT